MKVAVLFMGLLATVSLWPPMGHSAHHRHGPGGHSPCRPVPVRVLRSAGPAKEVKVVRVVR